MSIGSEPCPVCGKTKTRVVRNAKNVLRVGASLLLLPVYLLGGLAGDHRGPLLPLERACPGCGKRFKDRSVIDYVARILGRG